ncbi:MAG TPA: LLM class F420-dependent oxidoreductase [Acidimicrobiia bacterium]|nr:LLM class F420-dependent oxidoreductase [Acidimicrobiia bacterium]
MARVKVGVQLAQQDTTIDELRRAWQEADEIGVDSIWVWDHFFPLYGDPDANHFEAYSLLGAMAVDTSRARFGALVTCYAYRNPNLLADLARTLHRLSGERFVLGIGSGWFERDFREYGYEFGTAAGRLRALDHGLPVIKARLADLRPPAADLPILVAGAGEQVTLRLAAEHADAWNTFGPPAIFRRKNQVLDEWCADVGRDPAAIERTVAIRPDEVGALDTYVDAGADHVIVMTAAPYDLEPVRRALT